MPQYGFFPAAGTNYTRGDEPEIARRLRLLALSEHLHLTGLSGFRTPAHSVAVGGFADDPHTQGAASDTPGVEGVSEKTLNHFGLTRPFAGAGEADHIQLLAKGKAGVGVGASIDAGKSTGVTGAVKDAAGGVSGAVGDALGAAGDVITAPLDVGSAIAGFAGNLVSGFASIVESYGLRLLEIIAGTVGIIVSVMFLSRAAGAPTPSATEIATVVA